MLEWKTLQDSIVEEMRAVAVPVSIVNQADQFRGKLEFESGAKYLFERVDGAEATGNHGGLIPKEVFLLHNAVKLSDLLRSTNGLGGHYLRCIRFERVILLHLKEAVHD